MSKTISCPPDKKYVEERTYNKLAQKVGVLEKEVSAHKLVVDKAIDKLRKALPHVNFED